MYSRHRHGLALERHRSTVDSNESGCNGCRDRYPLNVTWCVVAVVTSVHIPPMPYFVDDDGGGDGAIPPSSSDDSDCNTGEERSRDLGSTPDPYLYLQF